MCIKNHKYEDESEFRRHELVEKYIMSIKLHRMYLERELNRTGVFRSQHQMLMYISDYPNASQRDIAEHQHVSTATVAVSLKKLERGGYIRRLADENDNRFNQICITDKGKSVVDGSIQVFKRLERAMFTGFADDELKGFEFCLDRMRLNIEHLLQEGGGMGGRDVSFPSPDAGPGRRRMRRREEGRE